MNIISSVDQAISLFSQVIHVEKKNYLCFLFFSFTRIMHFLLTKHKKIDHTSAASNLEVLTHRLGNLPSMLFLSRLTLRQLQVNQAVLGIHGLDVQFTGVNFLESLVYLTFIDYHVL